jgi:hypothetical protein
MILRLKTRIFVEGLQFGKQTVEGLQLHKFVTRKLMKGFN